MLYPAQPIIIETRTSTDGNSLLRFIGIISLPPTSPPRTPDTSQLHPPLLLLLPLGSQAQLIRAPDASNNRIKALTLCAGHTGSTGTCTAACSGSVTSAVGTARRRGKAFPHTETLVFGGLFGGAEAVEAAVLSEKASVPLSSQLALAPTVCTSMGLMCSHR